MLQSHFYLSKAKNRSAILLGNSRGKDIWNVPGKSSKVSPKQSVIILASISHNACLQQQKWFGKRRWRGHKFMQEWAVVIEDAPSTCSLNFGQDRELFLFFKCFIHRLIGNPADSKYSFLSALSRGMAEKKSSRFRAHYLCAAVICAPLFCSQIICYWSSCIKKGSALWQAPCKSINPKERHSLKTWQLCKRREWKKEAVINFLGVDLLCLRCHLINMTK